MAADSFPQPGAARGHEFWLVEALLGLALVASAISLTTFLRRPEYLAATGAARPRSAGDYGDGFAAEQKPERSASLVGLVEDLGRFLIHYNILALLMYAADEFPSGFYFSYCDIVVAPGAVARLATAARNPAAGSLAASLVIDRRWADAYAGRTLHPVSEAELTAIESAAPAQGSRVVQVGKGAVPAAQSVGEFIGLAHFSPAGAMALSKTWQDALGSGGLDAPFGRAKTLRQAYLTDALNAMALAGEHLAPVFIDGEWREIDTQQDLAAAELAANLWSG